MKRRRTGVIGTLNLEVILGPLDKVPPPGRQRLVPRFELRKAGSGPSVGLVLRALGARPRLFGTVGDDDSGGDILRHLKARGLDLAGVERVPRRHTGICVSLATPNGTHRYISSLGAIKSTTWPRLMRCRAALEACDVVLLTGYFVLPGLGFNGARRLFKWLRRRDKTVALDPGWDPAGWPAQTKAELRELLRHVDVFLPNRDEARILSGKRDVRSAACALRALGPQAVFVKLESRGALVAGPQGMLKHPGFPRKVRDTTAAGEAFNAGVLYALTHGLDHRQALGFANATAALFVEAGEPAACTLARVLRLLNDRTVSRCLRPPRRNRT